MRRVRAKKDEVEGDPDYEDENEDEPIEPVRRCTYSQRNKGCFNEESLWRHVSIAIRVLCTALLFKLPMPCEVQSILPSEVTRRNFLFCVSLRHS